MHFVTKIFQYSNKIKFKLEPDSLLKNLQIRATDRYTVETGLSLFELFDFLYCFPLANFHSPHWKTKRGGGILLIFVISWLNCFPPSQFTHKCYNYLLDRIVLLRDVKKRFQVSIFMYSVLIQRICRKLKNSFFRNFVNSIYIRASISRPI